MYIRIGFLGGAILVLGLLYWVSDRSGFETLSPKELSALGLIELPEPRPLSNLDLVDHRGNPFDGSQLRGKWTYTFFGYTNCPDICPITMSHLKQTEDHIHETANPNVASRFQGMFVSLDPARDDVGTVKEFVEHFSEDFVGVTGEEESIKALAEEVAIGYSRIASTNSALEYLIEHQGHIVLFGPDGTCFGYIKPPFQTNQLVRIFLHLERSA